HPLPGSDAMQLPVFGPRAWLWLDFRRSLTNANQSLRLRMVKRLDDRPFVLRSFVAEAPIETSPGALGVLVESPRGIEPGSIAVENGRVTFTLKTPLEWAVNQELLIDLVSSDSNQMLVDFPGDRAVSFGTAVGVENLRRDRDAYTFNLVNPTLEHQVVNVRFTRLNARDMDLYLDGVKSDRLFDNEPRDGLSVIAAVSAVSAARAARLKKVAASIQAARETAYREGKIKLLEARF